MWDHPLEERKGPTDNRNGICIVSSGFGAGITVHTIEKRKGRSGTST